MYRNILPYNSDRDHSHIQGHQDSSGSSPLNHLRRNMQSPLTRTLHSGAQRVRNVLRRSARN